MIYDYVRLLREINVGGRKKVPMVKLKEIFSSLGYLNVQTYIQSGNVVFQNDESDTKATEDQIKRSIQRQFGFGVAVMVISAEDFREIMEYPWFF